jgi:Tfp pilus assembly protein PilF
VISRWSSDPEGDLRRASELAERGALLDPDHLTAHVARGALLRLRGRHEEALEAYRRAAAIDPVAGITSIANAGLMLILLGRPLEAQEPIQRALALAPAHPFRFTWLTHLGTARLHAGDFGAAAARLAQGLESRSHVPVAERRLMLAAALALHGDLDPARRLATVVRAGQPEVTLGTLRARTESTNPAYMAQREDRLLRALLLLGRSE